MFTFSLKKLNQFLKSEYFLNQFLIVLIQLKNLKKKLLDQFELKQKNKEMKKKDLKHREDMLLIN